MWYTIGVEGTREVKVTSPPQDEGVGAMAKVFEVGKVYAIVNHDDKYECVKRTAKCVWMRKLDGDKLVKELCSSTNSYGWWHIKADKDGNERVAYGKRVIFEA